eukprot:7680443-Lingulodinium_polyedra.AAC.1
MRGSAPMAPVPKRQAVAKMRGSVLQVPMAAPPTPPWRRTSPQRWSPPRSPPRSSSSEDAASTATLHTDA